jgi:unsaturated chondroitin disaccharide hydrolase
VDSAALEVAVSVVVVQVGAGNNYMNPSEEYFERQIDTVVAHIEESIPKIGDQQPKAGKNDLTYDMSEGHAWTDGYWASQLYLAYDYLKPIDPQKAELFKAAADRQVAILTKQFEEEPSAYDHGVGHIFMPLVALHDTYSEDASVKETAIKAADCMLERELLDTGVIVAWNIKPDYKPELKELLKGLTIVDTMDSIPLLFWASEVTGDKKYQDLAVRHAEKVAKYIIRDDGSTYHAYVFNPETGEPIKGRTWQGHDDESCWSRGQSWAIHGFALAYEHTKKEAFLQAAQKAAAYAIKHLPEDYVPYWDYKLPNDAPQYRDSSAAAIMASGLLSLKSITGNEQYGQVADDILYSLFENYYVGANSPAQGLLLHGTSSVPDKRVDTLLPYGDYFYLEALLKRKELVHNPSTTYN